MYSIFASTNSVVDVWSDTLDRTVLAEDLRFDRFSISVILDAWSNGSLEAIVYVGAVGME
jgi:hypothetical protein